MTGLRRLLILLLPLLLTACGGGGHSSSSSSVPVPVDSPVASVGASTPGTASPVLYANSPTLLPIITSAYIRGDGHPVVHFQVTDDKYNAILDLSAGNVRFIIAKLEASPLGNLTGNWQSYINQIEQPGVGPGLEPKLQATTENGTSGTFVNNGDGTYTYTFSSSVTRIDPAILAQANAEGLDLSYQPTRTHRIAMQFSGAKVAANPTFDFVPATGATTHIFHEDVVATANCNNCHSHLAMHGRGRVETQYCVTCHNAGSADANSGNTVDFKVMIHRIHDGANLPSVLAGGKYSIYGYHDVETNFSDIELPQDIRNCNICHAGSATATGTQMQTSQGDNWAYYASRKVCGSCHDNVDFSQHFGGQTNDENCMSCHSTQGVAGSIASVHQDPVQVVRKTFAAQILSVQNTAPGQFPIVDFAIVNPLQNNSRYDIKNDPAFTRSGVSLSVRMAWSTTDYTNVGNGADDSSSVAMNALKTSVANGDGSFRVTFSTAVPDGSLAPFITATGSGTIAIEGRLMVDVGTATTPDIQQVPLTNVVKNFSIDETGGKPVARRTVVDVNKCLLCHGTLSLHGGNRTDKIESCVTCHNPRNTDRAMRAIAKTPPTDGKTEQSIDFKVMIHGIHAAGFRQNPLQIVGYGGNLHVFDTNVVQFPGVLNNCNACHVNNSYELPLGSNVLATTVNAGASWADPTDDTVESPTAAVCSSCHDDATAKAHMETNGANFATTQAQVTSGAVLEQCAVCHGAGRTYAVDKVHGL